MRDTEGDRVNIGDKWNGWTVDSFIGEGSFGKVYRLTRTEFGYTYESALKVIRIPQTEDEVKAVRDTGMDEASVSGYFRSMAGEIVSELQLMSELRGNTNIVSYEDHSVEELEGGFGWEIYLRMEMLTPLRKYMEEHPLTTADVVRLGIDICKALEVCRRANIIHRDIKLENIFVSKQGDFKLGDFGIARQLEKTSAEMSKKGTVAYMAPEVYRGQAYDATVDTYSLGIVLYRLLNHNRLPFLPPYPAQIRFQDTQAALAQRFSGAQLPPPDNAGDEMCKIILRACAYDPADRFPGPTEMRQALEKIAASDEVLKNDAEAFFDTYRTAGMPAAASEAESDPGMPDASLDTYRTKGMFAAAQDTDKTMGMPEAAGPKAVNEAVRDTEKKYEKKTEKKPEKKPKNKPEKKRPGWLIPGAAGALLLVILAITVFVLAGNKVQTVSKGQLTVADYSESGWTSGTHATAQMLADDLNLELNVVNSAAPENEVKEGEADLFIYQMDGDSDEIPAVNVSDEDVLWSEAYGTGQGTYTVLVNKDETDLFEHINELITKKIENETISELGSETEFSVEFGEGSPFVSNKMGLAYGDGSCSLPECGYENPGFTFAGWDLNPDEYRENFASYYASDKELLGAGETVSEPGRAIAIWKVDPLSFETDTRLHDQIEVEEVSPLVGFHIIRNNSDVNADVVVVHHLYNDNGDETRVTEGETSAVPAGGTAVIFTNPATESNGETSEKIEYYVRESSLTPAEESLEIVRYEKDGEEYTAVRNKGDKTVPEVYLVTVDKKSEDDWWIWCGEMATDLEPGEESRSVSGESSEIETVANQDDLRVYTGYMGKKPE